MPNLPPCGGNSTPSVPHDCINGSCTDSSAYGTPGKYANAEDCQGGCATGGSCAGECVEAPELSALESAACRLQTKFCR
jgi:hypothetical protein